MISTSWRLRPLSRQPLLALVFSFSTIACGRVDDFDPIPPDPWGPFQAGSWVLRRETRKNAFETQVLFEKWEMIERDERSARLRVSRTMNDKTDVRDLTLALHGEPRTFTTKGRENLYLGSAVYPCAIRTREGLMRWTTKEIREWPLKEIETHGEERRVTRLVRRNESVSAGSSHLLCDVFEESRSVGGQETERATVWRSKEVPGQIVKKNTTIFGAGGEIELEMIVTGFETRP